ncbi:MAG: hypothetical protein IBX55_00490 [Methyloprofundus sp.]|nr:hypothetical protein [Methyloprofundus sp.]
MKKRILCFVEKPQLQRVLNGVIVERYEDQFDMEFAFIMPVGTVMFDYPKNLNFKEYPYLSEPRYRLNAETQELTWRNFDVTQDKSCTIFPEFDEIWLAPDLDASGHGAFDDFFKIQFGSSIASLLSSSNAEKFRFLFLHSLYCKDIEKEIDNRDLNLNEAVNKHLGFLSQYRAKRFFDYNFNINSMMAFGFFDLKGGKQILTKYKLLTLFLLRDARGVITQDELHRKMRCNPGTGKYRDKGVNGRIGSPMSFWKIVDDLVGSELISLNKSDDEVSLSQRGKDFINSCHHRICDTDLPYRLSFWVERSEDQPDKVRKEMTSYLSRFFKRERNKRLLTV